MKQNVLIRSMEERVELNNGLRMPWLGLGVFQMKEGGEVEAAVTHALENGYRGIDTASVYGNERGVGKALRESGVRREDIFLTTKVWNDDQRAKRILAAFEDSLKRLGTDYVDLYLVHWPVADCYLETWRVMEEIHQSGRARAIGVSNFLIPHLEDLLRNSRVVPAVNQIEFHPHLVQPELLDFCRNHGIQVEAWSPLMQGQLVSVPVIQDLAEKHQKTPAQIVLRWDLQHGVVTIPKSSRPERIVENSRVFDFELPPADMEALDALDQGKHLGPDPANFDF